MKIAELIERNCLNCHTAFFVKKSDFKFRVKKYKEMACSFCSLDCFWEYRRKRAYEKRICKTCGREFLFLLAHEKNKRSGVYCSRKCHDKSHERPESWEFKSCLNCGERFKAKVHHNQKYCNRKCSGKAWINRTKKKCEWCGNEYELRKSKKNKSRFCSHKCLNKWLHLDKEVLKKRVQSLRERFKNKENHPFFGKSHTKETKDKIGKANKGKFTRERNPNWHGGKSFEPYTLDFNNELRTWIRERDNYQCQICGLQQNGRKWSVHHINYDKSDHQEKNLITLCVFHHSATNRNRDKWQFFFESYQEIRLSKVN